MSWKRFAGPAILAGLAILILLSINVIGNMEYDEGDTVDPEFVQTSCCMGLLSILLGLSSIVWFSYALGMKSEKSVFLAGGPVDSQHISAPVARDSRSAVVTSTIGGPLPNALEKNAINKSEGDTARLVGFLLIFGSIAMFAIMVLLGFISILMSLGPGLGFSGGTCNDTCESIWSGAVLSKWISLFLFPCGLIALARPWSWFRSVEDIRNAAVNVVAVIVAIMALIAVIAFGGPALIVLITAGMAWLIYYQMEDVELNALKLDEANNLVWTISLPLLLMAIIASVFEFGFLFVFDIGGTILTLTLVMSLPLVVSVIVYGMIMTLSKLNVVGTDGEWGMLDLMKSVYSNIFDEEG